MGNKLYNLDSHQVSLSRDVIYKENYFSFKTSASSTTLSSLPLVNPIITDIDSKIISQSLPIPSISEPSQNNNPPDPDPSSDSPDSSDTDVNISCASPLVIPVRRTFRIS